jgi:hypothetical protein
MKVYTVGIVGESNYQAAVRGCSEGEKVLICHEPDNPFDDLALRVETVAGDVIGYIPKDNWLRGAIHDEGRGCAATIKFVGDNGYGVYGVRLYVTLTDDLVPSRSYSGEAKPSRRPAAITPTELHQLIRDLIVENSAKITCTCGEVYSWPIAGLTEGTEAVCPRCKAVEIITRDQLRSVDLAVINGVSAICLKQNIAPPSAAIIIKIAREPLPYSTPNQEPRRRKGFFRRLFD